MKRLTFLLLVLISTQLVKSQTKNFIDLPYIEVNGNADTLVTPNEIYIRIQLSEKDTRDRIPIEELEQKMVAALKGLSIDTEKDLTTSDMLSNFRYYALKSKDVIKTKLYIVKVSDAVTASKVFIKLEEIGISNTSIEKVSHSEIDNFKNRMRTKAIIDAKERAVALTKPLNQTVGSAIHIVDADNNSPQYLEGRVVGITAYRKGYDSADYKDLLKIEFEKIRVSANVSVSFILK